MEAEEAVGDAPGGDEGLTGLEERGDPGGADVGIEGREHVVDHPEDGLAAPGLAEVIALTGMMHLIDRQMTGGDEGMEEAEVIGTTGFDHRHGGEGEVDGLPGIRAKALTEGFESVTEKFFDFH
jgi:hypothetical protein